jgi:hypothetical protein
VASPTVTRKPAQPKAPDGGSSLLDLQRKAGNRAVAGLIGRSVVQRHPGPTENTEVETVPPAEAAAEQAPATATTDATSQPGTGTTGTSGTGGIKGDARKKAIEDTLRASATGMWALAILDKWSVPVNYEFAGTGSYHQGGKIYINKSLSVGAAALVMMHEAQHADTFKSGKQADRTKLGREEYVKKSIADEAEAVVRQIEGFAITKSLDVGTQGSGVNDALKARYLKVFYAKRDELEKANPKMPRSEINEICRKHTRDTEVTNWFYDGTFVTSTNNNSYGIFYGNQWDEVNNPPAKK